MPTVTKMESESLRESFAAGNAAAPGEAPRQIIQRPGGKDVELVTFPPGDREDPRNWPLWRKWSIVLAIMLIDLSVSWIASGFSPASMNFSEDLGVSEEVATLGLSLTVLGFALGPMTLAPLSEVSISNTIAVKWILICPSITEDPSFTSYPTE